MLSGMPLMPTLPRSDGREERLTVKRMSEMLTVLVTAEGYSLLTARRSRDG